MSPTDTLDASKRPLAWGSRSCFFDGHVWCEWLENGGAPARTLRDFRWRIFAYLAYVLAVWWRGSEQRDMRLLKDFAFHDSRGFRWVARAGSVINGASSPRVFWRFVPPFIGAWRRASVVHDCACVEQSQPYRDVHWMFYEACRAGGCSRPWAFVLYLSVRYIGPNW